jgi:DNA polymerase-3 subunit delta'
VSEEGAGTFFGNRRLVARLRTKVSEGRLPHGLIFSGPDGIGKRTFALRLAEALNCASPGGADEECGRCDSCRKIGAGRHPYVSMVTVEEDASEIKIEQIRRIRSQLELAAPVGAARVFLIDPADRMKAASSNALLKALEEPPDRTYFFLMTTNVHQLLVTIRSRCQIYHFSPLSLEEIRAWGVTDELVVRSSQGSIGRAISTDAEQLKALRDTLLEFLETAVNAREEDLAGLLGASADLARSKDEYREKLRTLGILVSDILYAREGIDDRIVNIDEIERIRQLASGVDLSRIVQIADCIRFIERALKNYVNRQMLTDALTLTLNAETSQILNDKAWEYR